MTPQEALQELDKLAPRIDRLRTLYEQYFMGFERIPPHVLRKDVERKFAQLERLRLKKTRVRFRLTQLKQRYHTYQRYWSRVMREIERGTYKRDVMRAARKQSPSQAPAPKPTQDPPTNTRQLYEEYIRARRTAGQPTDAISYEKLARSLAKQRALLEKKHGPDRRIEFVVAVKDGKALLRPLIR